MKIPNKTALGDEVILRSAINCTVENCYLDMQRTKERFGKPGGVVGYHLVHSYVPGETTPELAHEAGVEFARRLLGDKYEAVICTHINKEHLHCHIVFNSVSFVDGVKYRNAFKDYFEDIRGISNEVSRKYGFSVIQPEGSGQHYAEWNAERSGKTTIRDLVRQDLDAAIAASSHLRRCWIFSGNADIPSNTAPTSSIPPSSRPVERGFSGWIVWARITLRKLSCSDCAGNAA